MSVQLAVLSPLSVMEEGEKAPSRAVSSSAERVTPFGVAVADAAPVMVRSPSSAKVIVPLATKSCADASTSSSKSGSTADVSTVGALFRPLMIILKTAVSVFP